MIAVGVAEAERRGAVTTTVIANSSATWTDSPASSHAVKRDHATDRASTSHAAARSASR